MFDDQETHYPVPGETPWERLRYLATSTETIYPVPPYVCMKCRRVIVPRKWALILHDLAEFLGYFWLFGIWFWPSVGVAPAKSIALPSIALFLLCMRGGSAAGLCRHSVGAGYTGRSGRAVLCLGDAEERGLSALFSCVCFP